MSLTNDINMDPYISQCEPNKGQLKNTIRVCSSNLNGQY